MFLLTTKTEQQSNCFVRKKNATEKQILKIVDLNIFSALVTGTCSENGYLIKWTKCYPAGEGLLFQVWMDK